MGNNSLSVYTVSAEKVLIFKFQQPLTTTSSREIVIMLFLWLVISQQADANS